MNSSLWIILLIAFLAISGEGAVDREIPNVGSVIPEHLLSCYEDPTLINRDQRLPFNIETFIAIVRKLEEAEGAIYDLRTISMTLLQRFSMEGIIRNPLVMTQPGVIPFAPRGLQVPRHNLLLRKLIQGDGNRFNNESLTMTEQCTLHFMLSPTVDPWERGDENQICSQALNSQKTVKSEGALLSSCPLEEGVLSTPTAGAISLARVLGGICAGLQPLEISLLELIKYSEETNLDLDENTPEGEDGDVDGGLEVTDMAAFRSKLQEQWEQLAEPLIIDNTWAATIAGDLGEVIIRQGPRLQDFELGVSGRWDDSIMPKKYFMDNNAQGGYWELTAAEIRGGFDGLILSTKIAEWEQQVPNLRLSQVLEMYYTNRGIDMDPSFKACSRREKLLPLVSSDKFEKQIMNMARILLYRTPFAVQMTDEALVNFGHQVIDSFQNNLAPFLDVRCNNDMEPTEVNLTLILDSTFHNPTDTERFLHLLMQEVDVSPHGSAISILDGQTGNRIINQTYQVGEVFRAIKSANTSWPYQLRLDEALNGVYTLLSEVSQDLMGGNGGAVVVLGYGASPQNDEINQALQRITEIRKYFPDVAFIFVASNGNKETFEKFIQINTNDTIIVIDQVDIVPLVAKIKDALAKVPKRIAWPSCNDSRVDQFEAYIDLQESDTFRIHPDYFANSNTIYTKFQGVDYGSLTVCVSRTPKASTDDECKKLAGEESVAFEVVYPCHGQEDVCDPIFFTVTVNNSSGKCFEVDCRYPGQVRYLVRPVGLKCPIMAKYSSASGLSHIAWTTMLLAFLGCLLGPITRSVQLTNF